MTRTRWEDAFEDYRGNLERTLDAVAPEAARDSVRAAALQRRAAGLRRRWRWQRNGRVLVPALAALALGLNLWAGDVTARVSEEHALATLLLLDEPASPVLALWDDLDVSNLEEGP